MFPYHDENETQRTPIVTFIVIAACVLTWVLVQGAGAELALVTSVCNFGLIPAELMGTAAAGASFPIADGLLCLTDPGPAYEHIVTSMFLHAGWMHLLGNMWFLWLFGNNIEDSMTRPRFVAFYLLCGVAAALAQTLADPASIVPMVGASGAISGVMGAYLVLYPRVRVFTFITFGFFIRSVPLPAWVMLLYWTALQLLGGFASSLDPESGGVAFWAHIGGFVAGVVLVKLFSRADHIVDHRAHHWRPQRGGLRR